METDCVIVGGGVAGLSAAMVLGRARRRALVVDAGGQSNRAAAHVGGLLGLDGTPPDELYARGREQVLAYGVEIHDGEATGARRDGDGFVVTVGGGKEIRTRTLVLATGMDYVPPDLPGFAEHWGGAVFHCPFCHGWEVRDQPWVVCSPEEAAAHQLPLVQAWTDDVTHVHPDDVAGLRVEDGRLRAVVRKDGSEVSCAGVLVHAPLRRRGRLVEDLDLEVTDAGLVAVDGFGRTSLPGVYATGDLAVAPQQVAIAMGNGHLTGVAVVRELLLGR